MGRALMRPGVGRGGAVRLQPASSLGGCVLRPAYVSSPQGSSRLSSTRPPHLPRAAQGRPEPRWCLGEHFRKMFSPGRCLAGLAPKIPLCKEKSASLPTLQERPSLICPGRRPQALTQKLGTGLVGAERLCLLLVLAQQVEPGRAGQGAVQLGRDVVLHLSPACGGIAGLSATVTRALRAVSVILTTGQVLGQTDMIFAPPWTTKCCLSSVLTRRLGPWQGLHDRGPYH